MPALENLQLGCAVCKICCYTIWRKICCKKAAPPRPDFSVICLGISGAGKSTLLALLCGENLDNVEGPTTGFSIKAAQFKDCILNIKEIGGGEKVRPFWQHYYKGAEGVVFVVNSGDSEENLETARDCMYKALTHPALRGLPCVVIANCQDLPGARNQTELKEILELDDACSGRDWVFLSGSMKNISQLKEDVSQFTKFLIQPQAETETDGKQGNESDYNRI